MVASCFSCQSLKWTWWQVNFGCFQIPEQFIQKWARRTNPTLDKLTFHPISLQPAEYISIFFCFTYYEFDKENPEQHLTCNISSDFFATSWIHFNFFCFTYYELDKQNPEEHLKTYYSKSNDVFILRMKRQHCFQCITALSLCWWPLVTSYQVVKLAIW